MPLSLLQDKRIMKARANDTGLDLSYEDNRIMEDQANDLSEGTREKLHISKGDKLGAKDLSDGNREKLDISKGDKLGAKDLSDGNDGDKLGAKNEMRMEGDREERQEMMKHGANNEMEGRLPQHPQRRRNSAAERPFARPLSTRIKNKPMTYVESFVNVDCGKPREKKRKAKKKKVEEKRNVNAAESERSNYMSIDGEETRSAVVNDDATYMQTDGEETEHADFKEGDDRHGSIQTSETERHRIDVTIEPMIRKLSEFFKIEDKNEWPFKTITSEELFKKKGRKWRIPKAKRIIGMLKSL